MGLLQGLFAFIRRSAGKIVYAMFGWAVLALFGNVRKSEKTLLSAAVGLAAVWPVLLLGVFLPKLTAFLVAFVPLPKWVPSGAVRAFWILLALASPLVVGHVLASRARTKIARESYVRKLARGFQVTFALAAAFLVVFIGAPIRRLFAVAKRRQDEHVPLIIEREAYHRIAGEIRRVLALGGIALEREKPPWALAAPSRILRALGGKIVQASVPEHIEYMKAADFELVVNPNGVSLQGLPADTARAHALLAEAMTWTEALQTTDPEAQALEKQIKDVWAVYAADPEAHEASEVLRSRVHEISDELSRAPVPFDEWETLYRETLQLNRALSGKAQLIEQSLEKKEAPMNATESPRAAGAGRRADLAALSTPSLIGEMLREGKLLVEKEVALARQEIKADWKSELAMVKWLAVAFVAAVCALGMLFVAAVFALAPVMTGWLASLVIAGVLLLVAATAGVVGWNKRVRTPLAATRKTLKEDVQWAKNRVA